MIVSSLAAEQGVIRFNDLNWNNEDIFDGIKAYQQSKLANVMHCAALARRLDGTGVTTYSLHPGVIATEIGREWNEVVAYRLLSPLINWVIKTPFYGAQTTLYCCLEDGLSNSSGLYYSDCKEKKIPNKFAISEEDQEKLWAMSQDLVGLSNK